MFDTGSILDFPEIRKHLSFDPLIAQIRSRAEQLHDVRGPKVTYPIADAVMSALAMFSLKDPSLLHFEERRSDQNMKNLFRIQDVPSDTQMREILDPVDPDLFRPMFNDVFRELRRGKALQRFVFYDHCYLLVLDGTNYFSSNQIHCSSCLEKQNKKTGETTYYHQMLGAQIVHPDLKQVIPLAPEPIVKQDGNNKHDCERNASKRLLEKIRKEHSNLRFIVVEDGLASNAPHIRTLKKLRMNFLLGAKPSDHEYLFDEVIRAGDEDRFTSVSWPDPRDPKVLCEVSFANGLPLNKSNPDLLVNFLQYTEHCPHGKERKKFSWVTNLTITRENARHLMRGGRCRWKIENETFNTLKTQGYHFEHNYGHGKIHLSVVFSMLMMLAFLIDQTQELCCPLFRAVHKKFSSRILTWDNIRSHFRHFVFESMEQLYEVILHDGAKELPPPVRTTYHARSP